MKTMLQTYEEIRRKQQPLTSEEFWGQVEAFKDPVEPIQTSSRSSEALIDGPQLEESLVAVHG